MNVPLVVGLFAGLLTLTVANPFQEVAVDGDQLEQCSTSPDSGVYLVVPEEGCFYIDTSFNRRKVFVSTEDTPYTGKCVITEDGDIIVASGQDCIFEDSEDTYTMFVNIVKGSEETADEEGDEDGSSADSGDEYGDEVLQRNGFGYSNRL